MSSAEFRYPEQVTLEQYAALPEDERWTVEAVRGRLVREPRPAPLHNRVQARLIYVLMSYEESHGSAGAVLPETEFVLAVDPLTVLVPDVAWVSGGRIAADGYTLPRWHFAPDLAAEVVSPRNRPRELAERAADYLEAGSRLVWVVDPRSRTVRLHRPGAEPVLLAGSDELDGGEVLPGFSVPVAALFPE